MKAKYLKVLQIFISLIILNFVIGCTKFLEEPDKSNFTTDTYFTNATQAQSSVNAIYSSLAVIYNGGTGFGGGLSPWLMLEFATGLANTQFGEAFDNLAVRSLTNSADNSQGLIWWNESYKGIANANLSISKIPGITMDTTLKTKLIGEARFLRAFYYYNLVRIFGKVPLITSPLELKSPELYPVQASEEEVYNFIVQDLIAAEASGLPYLDQSGRVSLGAVKGLLSSVYLTMAGFPLQKGISYYQKAADLSGEIINSNQYSLFNSYNDLHSPAKKNKEENIFQVQFTPLIGPSAWQSAIVPYNKGISAYDAQTGAIYALLQFVNSFESGDKRAAEKQFFYSKYTLAANRTVEIDLGNKYIYKLFDSVAENSTASSGLNWTLMRYAEILLIYAEASNEIGSTPLSYTAINSIRRRAQLPDLNGLSKEKFRTSVWNEAWHELCYENKTWFNMVRLRKAYNETTNNFEDFTGHKFSYGPALMEKDLLFPIPTSAIQTNSKLIQNVGY